jgi:hypothetical protein
MDCRNLLTISLSILLLLGPVASADTIRIASQNLNRLFDDVDDGNREKIETSQKFQRRLKSTAEVIVRQFQAAHIIAFQEVENMNVLERLAKQITQHGGPEYRAILYPGNDISSINVGYLIHVKLRVEDTRQLFKSSRLGVNPLFSRPPLLVKVCLQSCLTLVNLHLRSMRGLRSTKKSKRVSNKRLKQAIGLAKWVDRFQTRYPQKSLMLLGDLNALTPHDGFTDIVGTIAGDPNNIDVRFPSDDLVKRDLIDLTRQIPVSRRYSYIYKGHKQILDYMLVSQTFRPKLKHIGFGKINRAFSDHAGLLAEFSLP